MTYALGQEHIQCRDKDGIQGTSYNSFDDDGILSGGITKETGIVIHYPKQQEPKPRQGLGLSRRDLKKNQQQASDEAESANSVPQDQSRQIRTYVPQGRAETRLMSKRKNVQTCSLELSDSNSPFHLSAQSTSNST